MASKICAVAGLVLVAVVCAVSALPDDYYSPYFRSYPPRPDCRSGLCPLPKRLVPDIGPNPPYYGARSYEDYGDASLCGNLCTGDMNCREGQRCCPTTCGYACQTIVHISD